jgi:inosose dehydratase
MTRHQHTPRATSTQLGSAPDSWGVWFADDPAQVPWQQFLDEVAAAGYHWLELGPYGYLPTDAEQLSEELGRRGLRVSGGTTAGALHRAADWGSIVEGTRMVAELAAALGARHMIFLPESYRDLRTSADLGPRTLDDESWRTLTRSADEIGRIVGGDYGIRLDFHPHADSHVQTQDEIERFLDGTDPAHVSLCLDTGHIVYGGGDNVALVRAYRDRIGYVHVKQMNPAVVAEIRANDLSFGDAVRRGVAVEPPNGVPDIQAVLEALGDSGASASTMFCVVEQDLYPCSPDTPLPIATRTHDYLLGLGVGDSVR